MPADTEKKDQPEEIYATSTASRDDLPAGVDEQDEDFASGQARTKAELASQPKVKVKLAEDTPVIINGYRLLIQGGVRVEVPQGVSDILEQAGRI